MLSDSPHAIEHGSSRAGRWLEQHRTRAALWIAAIESVVVLFSHDVTKWTVIALAVVSVLAWLGGRETRSQVVREILWIFAVSQLLVLTVPIGLAILSTIAIILFALLAVAALVFLFAERP